MRFPLANLRSRKPTAAFTMVEIALCLAIIGFGLVTIIGVLPQGLDVQKTNREETVIDQDAQVWMDALRSGARGFDNLTNYVVGITNYWTIYDVTGKGHYSITNVRRSGVDGYTYNHSVVNSQQNVPGSYGLTNGLRIIGLLSMPSIMTPPPYLQGTFQSNYVVAYVRAMSGSAADKYPQNNPEVLDNAFQYRMVVQNVPYVPSPYLLPDSTNSIDSHMLSRLQTNSHSLRLFFRWPVLPNGHLGSGRQTFRLLVGGQLLSGYDSGLSTNEQPKLYLFQPSTYTQ